MKKLLLVLCIMFTLSGCATQSIPKKVNSNTESSALENLDEKTKTDFDEALKNAYHYRTTASTEYENTAVNFTQTLFSEDHTDLLNQYHFTEEMKAVLTSDKLETFKTSLESQMGTFKEIFDINASQQSGYDIVKLNTQFDHQKITLTFSFDSEGLIAGIITEAYIEKSVLQKSDFAIEKQVKFGEPSWQLNGVITIPTKSDTKAVLILVQGSGPNDRNETIGPNAPFEDIALALAEKGIATFRYDKRTFTYGQKLKTDVSITPDEEVINDVVYASQYLRLETGLDTTHLYVLGHSLGGYLLPQISEQIKGVDGYIFMNANARPLNEIVLDQYNYIFNLDETISESESESLLKLKEELKKLDPDTLSNLSDDTMILGAYKAYWTYLSNYNPLEKITQIKEPMLFTQGLRDYQVSIKDFNTWQSHVTANQDATFLTFDTLNHLMMSGSEPSTPDEYYIPNEVSSEFIETLSNWILEKSK